MTPPDIVAARIAEARAAHERGWLLTPLRGKVPQLDAWQKQPAPDLETVLRWAEQGNLGLRTGAASGLLVIDEDTAKGGFLADVPATVTVETGGGGLHYYFRAPTPCPGNSASKLGKCIDSRGEGGQVVFVGSVHPTTHQVYRWKQGLSPAECDIAELPPEWLAILAPPAKPSARPPAVVDFPRADALSRYAESAIRREMQRVATASEGERNDTLNRAAFNLGQLVGGNSIPESEARSALLTASAACGLPASEARRTIDSGLSSGSSSPRSPVLRLTKRTGAAPAPAPGGVPSADPDIRPELLIAGGHTDDAGEYHEVGNHEFADGVLAALPPGALYERAGVGGELVGDAGQRAFRPITNAGLRVLIDRHIRLVVWKTKRQDNNPVPVKLFSPCNRDQAAVVLDAIAGHPCVRQLHMLTPYPVFSGDFQLSAPGWNDDTGVFYDAPPELAALDTAMPLDRCRALLDDLTTDFPWRDDESRQNFYALLFTPLIRPALGGNTPLFLLLSSLERTGKSKLAEQVLGGVILGHPTPAMQLGGSDEERDKRILAQLQAGTTVVHVDNVREFLDSAALASLLTASTYTGRVLGQTSMLSVPNTMTLVASGNNVRATGEIVKRTVPIQLQPRTDAPEERVDFKHPDLESYVASVRADVLGALLSSVIRWRDTGREQHPVSMGGFERWSRITGGILLAMGHGMALCNLRRWGRQADSEGEDLRMLVETWAERYGTLQVGARDLLTIAQDADLFGRVFKGTTTTGQTIAFARTVLTRYLDTPVGEWIIRTSRSGNARYFSLDKI